MDNKFISKQMKALVISGGGCKGSFAGGIAEYLILDCCHQYDIFVGCSTGSLLLPHLSLKNIDKIKNIFTNVRQEDIFNICPFKIKKTPTGITTKINHINTVRSFIKGCATFGESQNLRALINKSILQEELDEIKTNKIKIILAVSNLSKDVVEYIHADQCSHQDFCDWAWASCNYIPFMSVCEKNGFQYADGGFGGFIPIMQAIEQGATDIDVIVLEPAQHTISHNKLKNPFELLLRTFHFMNHQNSIKDLLIGQLMGLNRKVNIHLYHTPEILTNNPLIFSPKKMTQWWKDGYDYAKASQPIKFCHE